jgi:hypothetical protein
MLKKKSLASSFFWNFTPSTTPELSPTSSDSDSDEDMESSGSRPVSLAVSAGAFCPMRPTLDEVLANTASPPYTLSAFMAYLSQNHCLETLEFTLEAKRYRETYESLADRLGVQTVPADAPESQHLRMLWQRLLMAYIIPGAPREINLSSEVRDEVLAYREVTTPPAPETLDSAVKRIHDLMEESIFLPFLNSLTTSPSMLPQPGSPLDTDLSLSTTAQDENPMKRVRSRAKRISPNSSTKDLPATGRSSSSLGAVHALGKPTSGALLSTSGDSTSVALTDDSSPQSSPTVEEPMTPPTTPPASEPHLPMHSPKLRTENPWKKMGMKLGFKKRHGPAGSRDPKILGMDE